MAHELIRAKRHRYTDWLGTEAVIPLLGTCSSSAGYSSRRSYHREGVRKAAWQ